MATIRTCDRCGGREDACAINIERTRDNVPMAELWGGDLCKRCRIDLEHWLKPLPEGPQKRKQEEA